MIDAQSDLFALNTDIFVLTTVSFALVFALASTALRQFIKKHENPCFTKLFQDVLRGVTLIPLIIFTMSPLFPNLGKMAYEADPLLISIGALGGVFGIITDWKKGL